MLLLVNSVDVVDGDELGDGEEDEDINDEEPDVDGGDVGDPWRVQPHVDGLRDDRQCDEETECQPNRKFIRLEP